MTFSPAGRATVAASDQRRDERWNGTRAMHEHTPATNGIQIGSEVYRPVTGDADPEGGWVVGSTTQPDPETGEVQKAYKCLSFFHGHPRFVVLRESDVDLAMVGPVNRRSVRSASKRLALEFARSGSDFPLSWIEGSYRLAVAVAAGEGE